MPASSTMLSNPELISFLPNLFEICNLNQKHLTTEEKQWDYPLMCGKIMQTRKILETFVLSKNQTPNWEKTKVIVKGFGYSYPFSPGGGLCLFRLEQFVTADLWWVLQDHTVWFDLRIVDTDY